MHIPPGSLNRFAPHFTSISNGKLPLNARMGTEWRTETSTAHDLPRSPPNQQFGASNFRNLRKGQLGGVIFGCKNDTIEECLHRQLFGLPFPHFAYVKNIVAGLPLFLFNYSDRKLYGIFEAASTAKMYINPYAWTSNGSERTQFPAQVQIRVRIQCHPLSEDQFKPIILDNYYTNYHFWFELDHSQTSKLMTKLSSQPIASGSFNLNLRNKTDRMKKIHSLPSNGMKEAQSFKVPDAEKGFTESCEASGAFVTEEYLCLNGENKKENVPEDTAEHLGEKDRMYLKLKELAITSVSSDAPATGHAAESTTLLGHSFNEYLGHETSLKRNDHFEYVIEKNGGSSSDSTTYPSVIAQLIQGMQELVTFKDTQKQKMDCLEQKLAEAEREIQDLKSRCMKLELVSDPLMLQANETISLPAVEHNLDPEESIYLVGGYDGEAVLSSLDLYSPSDDVKRSLQPMNYDRCYAAIAKLNNVFYVFGGGTGCEWYDTVESYDPAMNMWNVHPSLNKEKGSLAGAALNDKIFAIGGGNGCDCFSDVEMYDLQLGRWIPTRSMLKERFALAGAELNGALYAVGGYDGVNYLKSAERFDPREHSWTRIESMNTERGCHALVAMNEKLYALGGFDGSAMVASTEVYDPRLGKWMPGEEMNQCRGYSAAAVVKDSIFAIGGVRSGEDVVETYEVYKEGEGWHEKRSTAIGNRCFGLAVYLGGDS
ncbi:unnamed protein product [Cuscuta epithymum]|uniref:DCD domain-containing protein n=1 Tax=Cuscuta epithymum TaxID=186058 RepID=A0AAV0DKF8_9ASTE|nr:unnamed protein product [Cuscuta epithymum]